MRSQSEGPGQRLGEGQRRPESEFRTRPGHAGGQVRGVVAERVAVSMQLDPFLSLRALASYSGLSVRKLRDYLALPSNDALPHYRVGGKVLVRRSEFDEWITRYRQRGNANVARVVEDVLRGLQPS